MRQMMALLLMLLLMLSPVPGKTQVLPQPLQDSRILWDQGQTTQTDLGLVHSWGLSTDLDAQTLAGRLEPFCGAHYGALKMGEQWLFLRSRDGKSCVLWLEDMQESVLSGVLSMNESRPSGGASLNLSQAPVAGAVVWHYEQPGLTQSWLLLAHADWQESLLRNDWGAEAGSRYWRKGPAELDVLEVEHEQERYLLLICRACEKEAS